MRKRMLSWAAAVLAAATTVAAAAVAAARVDGADPYLWLEAIEGPRALATVKAWNAATERTLTADPRYEQDRTRALAILDDEAQLALPDDVLGDAVTNLWRDARHPRGLWRIAPLDGYRRGAPRWRTLIDVDALGRQEGKSWVWHGARCLEPEHRRCLVSLSDGGTDADVVREFDVAAGRFVRGGFVLPQARNAAAWIDADTLLVATDFGRGTLTRSGLPRTVRRWRRGTPLSAATPVGEAPVTAVGIGPYTATDGARRWTFVNLERTFYERDLTLVEGTRLLPVPVPADSIGRGVIDGRLLVSLQHASGRYPAGAVVGYSLADLVAGRPVTSELVWAPTASQAVEEVAATDGVVWIKLLDDVSGRLVAATRGAAGWSARPVPMPANSTVSLAGAGGARDILFATAEGMLAPATLYAVTPGADPQAVQREPAAFDPAMFAVEQRFARSKDGTRIPYFLVTRRGVRGPVPALIHGYGGFRLAQTPTYLTSQPYRAGPLALFWVEQGNAFVLANLRGGGEYGPRWHQAALRDKRQNSFDDLHAVAEDLVRTGVSQKGRIAISGRSNGGVLVGAAMTQRPDLYGAAIAGSPLFDMRRFSVLSAGAQWVDEYGDPAKPADWAFIRRYSPYQHVRAGVRYPPIFIYGSTKDDRVHPGHARKMAARLMANGNTVYFREYLEGGHAVGADHAEDARRAALLDAFLRRTLMGVRPGPA